MASLYIEQLLYHITDCIEGVVQLNFDSLKIVYNSLKYANTHLVLLTKNTVQLIKIYYHAPDFTH